MSFRFLEADEIIDLKYHLIGLEELRKRLAKKGMLLFVDRDFSSDDPERGQFRARVQASQTIDIDPEV